MIVNSFLAATILTATSFGADNVPLNGASKCNNYVQVGTDLYPVGVCYNENNDPDDLADFVFGDSPYDQNMRYVCKATSNGNQACLQRMNIGCDTVLDEYSEECFDCNEADDQCECEVGGDASECSLYEETIYETTLSLDGWYCNKKVNRLERSVVNMCIAGSPITQGSMFTYGYTCGGYYGRSGTDEDWSLDKSTHTAADCSDTYTSSPTTMTNAPSPSPTIEGSTPHFASPVYCSESVCDGVMSPFADDREPQKCQDTIATVYRLWSELNQNNLYIPHTEIPPSKWKSYTNEGAVFRVLLTKCTDTSSIPLFECGDRAYSKSILTTSPEIECSEGSGYVKKERIGRCFAENSRDLVPLHRFYSVATSNQLYKTDRTNVDGYKYEGIECYVYPLQQSLKVTEQVPQSPIDLILMLDSSGSVADKDYSNWQAEIDYAASLVDSEFVTPGSRVALINYSGCGGKLTFEECQEQNKLKKEWGLTEYSTKDEVLDRLDSMGPGDFNYGFTWTDEALSIALAEFEATLSGGEDHERYIIMLTAGEPSQGHESCRASTDYMSETVVELKALGVNILTGAISMTQEAIHQYFDCLGTVFALDTFNDLYDIEE